MFAALSNRDECVASAAATVTQAVVPAASSGGFRTLLIACFT